MRTVIILSAVAVAALGWLGAGPLAGREAAGYLGGALTLAGALAICALFTLNSRWHGIIGGGVVALLGAARNLPAAVEVARNLARGSAAGPADLGRVAIAAVCLGLVAAVVRALLAERARRSAADLTRS